MADNSYTSLLNGSAVAATVDGLQVINSATTVTLTADSNNPLAKIIEATFTAPGQQLRMPDARLLSLGGAPTIVVNRGSNAFGVHTNTGATLITNVGSGEAYYIYATANATQDGVFAARIQGVGSTADIATALAGFGLDAVAGQLAVDAQALAGAGLTASSPQSAIDVNPDNSTIEINADQVRVKALGITAAQIADGTITSAKLASGVSIVQKFSNEVNGMATSATLSVSTPGVPATDARFNRFVQVVEEVTGSPTTDTSWDFDLADRTNYDTESSTPVATLTPSDNGNTTLTATEVTVGGTVGNEQYTASNLGQIFAGNTAVILPGEDPSTFAKRLLAYTPTLSGAAALFPATAAALTPLSGGGNNLGSATLSFCKMTDTVGLQTIANTTSTHRFDPFSVTAAGITTGNSADLTVTASGGDTGTLCNLTDTTALFVGSENGTTGYTAVVVTTTGVGPPTFGTPVNFTLTGSPHSPSFVLRKISSTATLLTWRTGSGLNTEVRGRIITVSGTVPTLGADTLLFTKVNATEEISSFGQIPHPVVQNATQAWIIFDSRSAGNSLLKTFGLTISGTTITPGSETTILTSAGLGSVTVQKVGLLGNNRLVVAHKSGATSNQTLVAPINVTGTPSLGTGYTSLFNLSVPTNCQAACTLSELLPENLLAFMYTEASNSSQRVMLRWNGTDAITAAGTTLDLGYNCALSAAVAQTNWLGSVLSGNSGYVRITDFTQQATGGTALSSAGTPANGFDDNAATVVSAGANGWVGYDFGSPQTVRIVGIRINVTGQYNLIIEGAIDSVFTAPVVLSTPGIVRLTASQIYWFPVSNPQSFRYVRIRETGGATFTIQDLYCNFGTSVRAQTAFTDFASLAAITTGNWTLNNTVFTNGGVASDASETNEVLITTNSSDIDTSNWEDADSLTPVTETTRIKNQTYPYVLGRGNPVTSTNLYGVEPGQYLFTQTVRNTSVSRLTDTKLLYSYSDGASQFARLLTLSAGIWTPTTAFAVGTSTFAGPSKIVALDATRAVVFWQDGGTLRAIVVLESAGSLSAGAAIACSGTSTNGNFDAVLAGTDKILLAGRLDASALGINARILSMSGTTITVGTLSSDFDTTTASSNNAHSVDIIATNKALFAYRKSGVTEHRCVVLTLDLTANTVVGGTTVLVKAANTNSGLVQAQGTDRALITYADSSTAWSRIVTVSGTTPTLQTEATLSPGTVTGPHTLFKVDNSNFFAGYSGTALVWLKVLSNTVLQAETSIFPGGLNYLDTQTTESGPSRFPATVLASGQVYCLGFDNTDTASGVRIAGWNYADWSPVLAFSFNARSTWRIWQLESSSLRNIASSLASVHGGIDGIWYYQNASNVWVAASINTQRQALKEAFLVQVNRTPAGFYTQLSDADWNTFGWVKGSGLAIDLAVGFDATNSELSQLTWNYTSRSQWNAMAEDAYRRNLEDNTQVIVTKLSAGPSNIKANVLYVT